GGRARPPWRPGCRPARAPPDSPRDQARGAAAGRHPRSLPRSARAAGHASTRSVVAHGCQETCAARRPRSNTSLLGGLALRAIALGAVNPLTGVLPSSYIRLPVLNWEDACLGPRHSSPRKPSTAPWSCSGVLGTARQGSTSWCAALAPAATDCTPRSAASG